MEVTTREALEIAVSWVVPSFILSVIFRLFVPFLRWGRDEAVLGYLSIGSVFAALRLFGVPTPLITFLLPALLGLLLGVVTYRYRRLISHLLPLPPTAWDAAFWRRLEPCLVVVVMKDGTIIRGVYGLNSRASSDPDRRDLFLEGVLVQDATGRWRLEPLSDGLWIDGSQIVMIKFVAGGDRHGEGTVKEGSG
jgi:hypothetical protein